MFWPNRKSLKCLVFFLSERISLLKDWENSGLVVSEWAVGPGEQIMNDEKISYEAEIF